MAVTSTSQIVLDGPRNVVWRFTGIGDGQGDVTNAIAVDTSQLAGIASLGSGVTSKLRVKKINYKISYGIVQLLWDTDSGMPAVGLSTSGVPFANLEGYGEEDFSRFGGLANAGGQAATGNILLSTIGFELNSTYDLTLQLVKFSDYTFIPNVAPSYTG